MNKILVDASALLAVIYSEKGHEIVEEMLEMAVVSSVNYAEVISKMVEKKVPAKEAEDYLSGIIRAVLPFDKDMAFRVGQLRSETKSLGLSLGDRACLATALNEGLEVLTADRAWLKLKTNVKIRFIR